MHLFQNPWLGTQKVAFFPQNFPPISFLNDRQASIGLEQLLIVAKNILESGGFVLGSDGPGDMDYLSLLLAIVIWRALKVALLVEALILIVRVGVLRGGFGLDLCLGFLAKALLDLQIGLQARVLGETVLLRSSEVFQFLRVVDLLRPIRSLLIDLRLIVFLGLRLGIFFPFNDVYVGIAWSFLPVLGPIGACFFFGRFLVTLHVVFPLNSFPRLFAILSIARDFSPDFCISHLLLVLTAIVRPALAV